MELYEIMLDIAGVENDLAEGMVDFSFPKLMMAMKARHPADILDDIITEVGNQLFVDSDAKIPRDQVETLLNDLKSFQQEFQIVELLPCIYALDEYLKQ